ncbi:hypothetical protein HYV70_04150 [Candidatus Uhrbacteria bacterium]|nr:hypothetical protein [Candidatus Uhrbacteria bacterium]
MYDLFVFGHREFSLIDARRIFLSDNAFYVAGDLAASSLNPSILTDINSTSSMKDHVTLAKQWLEKLLKHYPGFSPWEQFLVEAILLNKAALILTNLGYMGSFSASLGAMIQQRMTLVLSVVEKNQWSRIQGMHKLRGVDGDQWKRHITGADAAAYVLTSLANRENARIFLPSIYEDAKDGIDLFWLEHPFRIAVSVKCVRGSEIQAWHATQEMTETSRIDMERLLKGLRHIQMFPGVDVEPVVVHVGNINGGSVSTGNFNINWAEELLTQIHAQRRRGLLSLVRE